MLNSVTAAGPPQTIAFSSQLQGIRPPHSRRPSSLPHSQNIILLTHGRRPRSESCNFNGTWRGMQTTGRVNLSYPITAGPQHPSFPRTDATRFRDPLVKLDSSRTLHLVQSARYAASIPFLFRTPCLFGLPISNSINPVHGCIRFQAGVLQACKGPIRRLGDLLDSAPQILSVQSRRSRVSTVGNRTRLDAQVPYCPAASRGLLYSRIRLCNSVVIAHRKDLRRGLGNYP